MHLIDRLEAALNEKYVASEVMRLDYPEAVFLSLRTDLDIYTQAVLVFMTIKGDNSNEINIGHMLLIISNHYKEYPMSYQHLIDNELWAIKNIYDINICDDECISYELKIKRTIQDDSFYIDRVIEVSKEVENKMRLMGQEIDVLVRDYPYY